VSAPLFIEDNIIQATTGVQQGDPLGPLLFALVLHPLLMHIKQTFSLQVVGAYLDDVTILGPPNSILEALNYFGLKGPSLGLHLSPKTTIWSPFSSNIPSNLVEWRPPLMCNSDRFSLSVSVEKGVVLLGGGVSRDSNYLTSLADIRYLKWGESINLMMGINDPFIQLQLLRSCLGVSKLNYFLRCTPFILIQNSISKMEIFLKDILWSIITNKMPGFADFQFHLATLPISESGLGIYNPADVSKFAFIASFSQTKGLQDQILDLPAMDDNIINIVDEILPSDEFRTIRDMFITKYNNNVNIEMPALTQSSLASIFYKVKRGLVINHPYITLQQNDEDSN
jgi:hypothetical protein